jgi:response regulator of citrate/malate metabolism
MVKENLVFIIDDDLMQNEIHVLLLRKMYPNVFVKTFVTAVEALQAIDNQEMPETIFLDLHIPGENETFFLKEHYERSLTSKIYLMSSMDFIDEQGLFSTFPAINDFICKPLLDHKIKSIFNQYV